MGLEPRIEAFERWSKRRGLVARDVDRLRVARDLFELADGGPVASDHVEMLGNRYRDGLMGPRAVLAAKRVGHEVLEWQDEDAVPDAESDTALEAAASDSALGAPADAAVDEADLRRPDAGQQRSEAPSFGDFIELDVGPKSVRPGFDKAPSQPPATNLGVLTEVRHDPASAMRRSSAPPPPPGAEAPPAAPPLVVAAVEPRPASSALFMRIGVIVGAIGLLLAIYFLRDGLGRAEASRSVEGSFSSKHLGLSWEFAGAWQHAQDRDDKDVTKDGWTRRRSEFFRGDGPTSFKQQLVIITFQRSDARASAEVARQLGANEPAMGEVRRRCDSVELASGAPVARCFMLVSREGQPLALQDLSFELDGRAVFVRVALEMPVPIPSRSEGAEIEALGFEAETKLATDFGRMVELAESMKPLSD